MEDKDLVEFDPPVKGLEGTLMKLMDRVNTKMDRRDSALCVCPNCGDVVKWKDLKPVKKNSL